MSTSAYESGLLFNQAHSLVRQRTAGVLIAHQISFRHWSILTITGGAEDGIRLSSVATKLNVKAPLITMESSGLIAAGLIKRIPHHSDSRAKLLVITPKGKKLLAIIEQELNQQIELLLAGLSDPDINGFRKTLTAIINNS